MNRELKFRIWDCQNNKFWYLDKEEILCSDRDYCCYNHINYKDILLQQFTGLKDKNGKEIYEGDIIQTYKWNGYGIEKSDIGKVFYHKYACRYSMSIKGGTGIIFDLNTTEGGLFREDHTSNQEVIGNIFENPDLLK